MNNDSLYGYYLEKLKPIPDFLEDFLNVPSLVRLKKVGYFCGMDYASKDIYSFKEYISRFDHSLSVALLTWKVTHDKIKTLAALFHDIATPCFAHVIDYMNKDYTNQESTEEYTDRIIREDEMISVLLSKHNIPVEDIIDFKKYSIVDNKRPKLCIDRFDGIVLSGIAWCKTIGKKEIDKLVDSLKIYELDEEELGFNNRESAALAMDTNNLINKTYIFIGCKGLEKIKVNKQFFDMEKLVGNNEDNTKKNYYLTNSIIYKLNSSEKFFSIHNYYKYIQK